MSDNRRRRRSDEGRESGGLPLIPLVLVVVFAGLLLGALLAHFFGGGSGKQSPGTAVAQATPLRVTPVPSELPALNPTSSPSPSLSPSHKPSPGASPSASPSTSPRPSTSMKASPAPTTRPALSPHPAGSGIVHEVAEAPAQRDRGPIALASPAVASAPSPVATAAPAAPNGTERAAGVVRSYLLAMANGNRALATTYLASGTPGEVFMDSTAHVVSLKSTASGTGYHVAAEVQTAAGSYAVTFSVQPGTSGLQITDHYAIKEH